MGRYIALLRGVNVGGKNKISMPQLKRDLEERGFERVITYINSGNVIFDSGFSEDAAKIACETVIFESFGLEIAVCIISACELREALANVPDWWNNGGESKHNAIFVIPLAGAEEVCAGVGEVKPEYERVAFYGRLIFWSAPLATFSHTRWSKVTKNKAAYNAITIRNANTALKLLELAGEAL